MICKRTTSQHSHFIHIVKLLDYWTCTTRWRWTCFLWSIQ